MVQKQILKTGERCVYRIQESNLDFYMVIPNCLEINLILGLMDLVTDEKVASISKFSNKVVMIPVLDKQVLLGIQQNRADYFEYLDKYFSSILNLSHKILIHNKLKVLDTIYFSSSLEYRNFQNWFIQKYNGRVQPIEISFDELGTVVQPKMKSLEPTASPVVESNFIGENEKKESSLVEEKSEEVVPTDTKEPGFVSYVLLGVVVAVLSLVFLYFII